MTKQEIFDSIKGKVIVSCQAVPGEPLYVEEKSIMYLMARAAKRAGTPMIRTSSIRDVVAIKEETGLTQTAAGGKPEPCPCKKETDQTPGHTWPDGVCIPAGCRKPV